jgi:hypothetical protein
MSPTSATAGGAAFTLTVNGSNFINGSVVQWNGSARTTTFVSASQLTATIPASDIATGGTPQVTVFNPAPGGGTSGALTFTISNPVPTTTSLNPASAVVGGAAFTLTVNGSNFVTGSVVQWNGSARTTTFVSSTQLTAAIPATDIAATGTATVTVFNPTPGGGTSNAQTFSITSGSGNPVPVLNSISPPCTARGGPGFTLNISGSNFISGSVVQWNGSPRTTTFVSSTQLTAAIPAADIAATGTPSVTVFNPAPGGGLSSALTISISPGGCSLRFRGNGVGDIDRVKIRIDDPSTPNPDPPANVGATNFTLEFWMRAAAAENTAGPQICGANINWINGNIVFDRDRFNQDRKFGLSIVGGRFIFGVSGNGTGNLTICGATNVLDNLWHHVAVQRRPSDGQMWLFVDGISDATGPGPAGDISYPFHAVPGNFCGPNGSGTGTLPCLNDPFLVIGAEKHDAGSQYPSYSGFIDEVRISTTLRYPTSGGFAPPTQPFVPDGSTAALYHFDEGQGDVINDSSLPPAGGLSPGVRRFGTGGLLPAGPEWVTQTPFP